MNVSSPKTELKLFSMHEIYIIYNNDKKITYVQFFFINFNLINIPSYSFLIWALHDSAWK